MRDFMLSNENINGVYFSALFIRNVKCFKKEVYLNFLNKDKNAWKRWTIILGENGIGKTTLLQALASFEMAKKQLYYSDISYESKYGMIAAEPTVRYGNKNIRVNVFNEKPTAYEEYDTMSINHIFSADGPPVIIEEGNADFARKLVMFSYGAGRTMSNTVHTYDLSDGNSETLFTDDKTLINAEQWLLQFDYAASKDSAVKEFAIKKRDSVKAMLIDLLPDIEDIKILDPTKEQFNPSVSFKTSFGWLKISQLGLGYKTMIAWIVDLAARMFARYPDSDNPLAEPAIVLLDEIDLHLHPKWQRNIFKYLSDRFPATQFIVTAHSPLIVQAAPEDVNLVVLQKKGDTVVIDQNLENVKRWRIDQILTSDLFGLESARDSETTAKLEERSMLLDKKARTVQEEKRLGELNELANSLPTADNKDDNDAMDIIRKAASYLKDKKI
jgi:predicted ATPase